MENKLNENTQMLQVLGYLKKNGTITSQIAWREFNITRLAAIIFRLRRRYENKYEILTKRCKTINGTTYAEYHLKIKEA